MTPFQNSPQNPCSYPNESFEQSVARAINTLQYAINQLAKNGVGNPGNTTSPGGAGKSAYDLWLDQGHSGSLADFILSLKGPEGDAGASAYQLWVQAGNSGTTTDFLNSLRIKGNVGDSAYQIWVKLGNAGSEQDFINSLKGSSSGGSTGSDEVGTITDRFIVDFTSALTN